MPSIIKKYWLACLRYLFEKCDIEDSSVVEWSLRGITTPLGVASYQLQEVYERTLLEIKQEAAEEED